jgi:HPt (histidine-containing phosphotransfer) domain-containing protein
MTEPVDHQLLAALSQATGDDPAFLAELIDTYVADAPNLLTAMRDALATGDSLALRRAAHTLKSNSATFGARRLADLCRRLEQGEGPSETLLAEAQDEYVRVRASLQAARPRS